MAKAGVKLGASDFVHLHTHTHYSLLDGLTKVPALVERVKKLGMNAVAITDHGYLSGAIEFYKAAKSAGVQPIIGLEAYVAPRTYLDKDPMHDRQQYHLTMLAMNNQGYQNLLRLATIASLEGFYYKPRIDRQLIEKYNAGLIVLSGCIGGEVGDQLRQGQYDLAKKTAQWYKGVLGDRYYLELADHGHPKHPTAWREQRRVNDQLLKLSEELKIPAVVTCDAHYLEKDDQEAHEALLCVQTGAFFDEEDRMSLKDFELYVANPRDIIGRWGADHPELITNTRAIAERCSLKLQLEQILIPKFPTPAGETEKSLLQKQVWRGLAWRYGKTTYDKAQKLNIAEAKTKLAPEIIERVNYELGVVNKMGFNGVFLIAADFINWGKDKGIVFGPGRGSVASSILAYATRITEVDPLKYDLLFERFLNPDRISMPDMDIDIQDDRRDEVINYCIEKYGKDRVANIITFGTMAARNSVRDVARVLRVPYAEADRLAKMIPPPVQGRHTPLSSHLRQVAELARENAANPTAARVFALATRLEGTIRSHGVHAAGVVIAPDEIVKFVPLEMAQKGVIATQYSVYPIEELGFLKIDFLGLSNMTTIKNALRIIKKVNGQVIDINSIPLDDQKTYQLLQKGRTIGVFQLESAGMTRYLKQLKPTEFEDIIAMVALYRPGPMQWIDDFIARKHGRRKIEYLHPLMASALRNTYGVIVYQEQVMQISKDLCGFSGGQADTLRKGIAKKIPSVLAKMKKEFIDGAVKHSKADRRIMEKFWAQLEEFAAYCFNKVHSSGYAMIAYQTAYLKAHYPDAFMAALMTSDYDNIDRLAIEIAECKAMGIEVLAPDVNESFHEFGVVPGKKQIRFGLDAVKNVGYGAAEEILVAREKHGKFKTLSDFCKYVNPQVVNRKGLESLIKAGALDCLGERVELLNNIENILAYAQRLHRDEAAGQVGLFGEAEGGGLAVQMSWSSEGPAYTPLELLNWERELLGLYLSEHPLSAFNDYLAKYTTPINRLDSLGRGAVKVGGHIVASREITTRNGAKMAFVRLSDRTADIELVVFPQAYAKAPAVWQRDQIIIASGNLDNRNGELKVLVEEARVLKEGALAESAEPADESSGRLYIRLSDDDPDRLVNLKKVLDDHAGQTEVVLVTGPKAKGQAIRLPQKVAIDESGLRELSQIFGTENVVYR